MSLLYDAIWLGNIIHVVPVGDWVDHFESKECDCKPEVREPGIIIHNSYDAREHLEE